MISIPASATVFSTSTVDNTSYYEGTPQSNFERQQRIANYRSLATDLVEKINALGTTTEQFVNIPVLLGVNIQSLLPNYGVTRVNDRTHEGQDILAPVGTLIFSPTDAVIIRIGFGKTEGNYVFTANPGGETFVYMHLDTFAPGIGYGTILKPGSLIGFVGKTGNAKDGPSHLHFEIHDNTNLPTNPFPRLKKEFTFEEKIKYLSPMISRDIFRGMYGVDVQVMQHILNARGYTISVKGPGSYGNETMFFGAATAAALGRFQMAHQIYTEWGFVGSTTRAMLMR